MRAHTHTYAYVYMHMLHMYICICSFATRSLPSAAHPHLPSGPCWLTKAHDSPNDMGSADLRLSSIGSASSSIMSPTTTYISIRPRAVEVSKLTDAQACLQTCTWLL